MSREYIKHIDISKLPPPKLMQGEIDPDSIFSEFLEEVAKVSEGKNIDLTFTPTDPIYQVLKAISFKLSVILERDAHSLRQAMIAFAKGDNLDHLTANGGIIRSPSEADRELRERFLKSFERMSTAGSRDAYIVHAEEAGTLKIPAEEAKEMGVFVPGNTKEVLLQAIKNLKPHSEEKSNEVKVYILPCVELQKSLETTEAEEQLVDRWRTKLKEQIFDKLHDSKVKPLCDRVTLSYSIIKTYYLKCDITLFELSKSAKVLEKAQENLRQVLSESQKIGASLPLSAAYAALHRPGVSAVEIHVYADRECQQRLEIQHEIPCEAFEALNIVPIYSHKQGGVS